jgi:hypothetical protein
MKKVESMSARHNNNWQEENCPVATQNATSEKRMRVINSSNTPRQAMVLSEKIDLGKLPMMLAGVAIAAGLIGIILFYNATISDTKNTQATRADIKVEEWQGMLPLKVAENFIAATTNEERLKWVRDPEANAPLLEEFFTNGPGAKEKILNFKQIRITANEKFIIHRYQLNLEGGDRRLLCVVQMDNSAYVDFKAYARHCSSKWQDLLSGSASAAAEVRVFLDPGTAYMNQYADEEKWTSYIATTQDWDMPLYFYAARNSKTDEALLALTRAGTLPATLAIRSNDNSHEKKQFEIVELLTPDWCY